MRPYVQTHHVCFGKGNVRVKTNLHQPVRELAQNRDKEILFIQAGYFPCTSLRLAKMREANLLMRASKTIDLDDRKRRKRGREACVLGTKPLLVVLVVQIRRP